jgi:4-amino-4-deoxy-L-arabinose transferase-like glycosyltransferase
MNRIKIGHILPLFVILIIYFLIRLQNLTAIPVFGDEAIYLRWSQLIRNVETLRFIPLTDGKQPLFMWITAILLKFFSDPLIAGRLVSVFSGASILIITYIFSYLFFSYRVAIISSLVYILLPFSFFFDRLALPDTLLSAFGVLSLLMSFLLAKYPRLDIALLTGFSLGTAWLTKSPAVYFVVLTFITFILYQPKNYQKLYYPLISSVIAFVIYNILRLGPQFQQIALRNQDYIWSIGEILKHPLDPLVPHIRDIFTIYSQYISLPIIFLSIIGVSFSLRRLFSNKNTNILILWWILPLIATATFTKVFTARYILFTLPPLVILISLGISNFFQYTSIYFKNTFIPALLILLCFSLNILWIYQMSVNPFFSKLSSTETGYLISWTSGWGIKQSADNPVKGSQCYCWD